MTDREKLIDLIYEATEKMDCPQPHDLANYLIANGVVIREKGEWKDYGEGVCCNNYGISLFHQDENNNWGIELSKFNFCPNCGSDMRKERK